MGTHEGSLAHPHVLAANTHKILKSVLPSRLLGGFLGVPSLDIAQLEASEKIRVLQIEVT